MLTKSMGTYFIGGDILADGVAECLLFVQLKLALLLVLYFFVPLPIRVERENQILVKVEGN